MLMITGEASCMILDCAKNVGPVKAFEYAVL